MQTPNAIAMIPMLNFFYKGNTLSNTLKLTPNAPKID